MKFIEQPQNWFKRRNPTAVLPKIVDFEVTEFEKVDDSYCKIFVEFDNGDKFNVNGRVSRNVTNIVGGGVIVNHWTVQGINARGLNVVFKLLEEKADE